MPNPQFRPSRVNFCKAFPLSLLLLGGSVFADPAVKVYLLGNKPTCVLAPCTKTVSVEIDVDATGIPNPPPLLGGSIVLHFTKDNGGLFPPAYDTVATCVRGRSAGNSYQYVCPQVTLKSPGTYTPTYAKDFWWALAQVPSPLPCTYADCVNVDKHQRRTLIAEVQPWWKFGRHAKKQAKVEKPTSPSKGKR